MSKRRRTMRYPAPTNPLEGVEEAVAGVTTALPIELPDALIQSTELDHRALMQAVAGHRLGSGTPQHKLLYALLCSEFGLRNTAEAREVMARQQLIMSQMVHNAAALGIQAERTWAGAVKKRRRKQGN